MNSTLMYSLYLYKKGFSFFQMGYASAMAWVLVLLIGIFTLLLFGSSKLWVHYEDGGNKLWIQAAHRKVPFGSSTLSSV